MSDTNNNSNNSKKNLAIKILGQVVILAITITTTASVTRYMVLSELGMLPVKEPPKEVTAEVSLKENASGVPEEAEDTVVKKVSPNKTSNKSETDNGSKKADNTVNTGSKKAEDTVNTGSKKAKPGADEKIPVIFKDERQAKLEQHAKKDPQIKKYLMSYPGTTKPKGGITEEELKEEHPHFLQWDERWGYTEYGDGILAICGCAPTALATVVADLTGKPVTPHEVAKYCDETGLYIEDVGTDWSLFSKHSKHFGVSGKILPISEENMKRALDSGHPIILSVGKGDFTKNNGHIIVLVDCIGGKFVVRDPGSVETTKKLWSFEELAPQIKNLWEYTLWE